MTTDYQYRMSKKAWIAHLMMEHRDFCWFCHGSAEQVEHILHGRARGGKKGLADKCLFFRICHLCHMDVPKSVAKYLVTRKEPRWVPPDTLSNQELLAAMLAIKKRHDLEHFDRSRLLSLYGYADTFVTEDEVTAAS